MTLGQKIAASMMGIPMLSGTIYLCYLEPYILLFVAYTVVVILIGEYVK